MGCVRGRGATLGELLSVGVGDVDRPAPNRGTRALARLAQPSPPPSCPTLRAGKFSQDNFDLGLARGILDEDHYGMTDVKGARRGGRVTAGCAP